MVHHTVQEKHQDKLKTTIIQFIMLTYFLSVIMKDPVVVHLTLPFPDQMTRVEFEADLLKDDKIEREEEVRKALGSTVQHTSLDEAAERGAEEADGAVLCAAAG